MDKLFQTEDGSHSILSQRFNSSYHSHFGAIQESQHVFIQTGLHSISKTKTDLKILELGFGTGLNALLTLLYSGDKNTIVEYCALEAYPLSPEVTRKLNYPALLNIPSDDLSGLHDAPWETNTQISTTFRLTKLKMDFLDFQEEDLFDIVYFDAFAPDVQPELWTTDALSIFVRSMKKGGILTTYCVKGMVRRSFESLGCKTERLPGPPGKREILRVIKI